MKIKKIKIKNYRLLKDVSIDVEDDLSLIVGKNNSGKTSVLLLLDTCLNNSKFKFKWDDFNIQFRNDLKNAIKEKDYSKINDNFSGIYLRLFIEYYEYDNLSNISEYMLDLDENNTTIILEFSYIISEEKFKLLIEDFNDTFDLEKHFESNVKSIIYDVDNDKEGDLESSIEYKNINNLISFKHLSAKRDTSNEEENKLSNLAYKYYNKNMDSEINEQIISKLENTLNETDKNITEIYEDLFKDVTKTIKNFGGINDNDSIIKIISSINKEQLLDGNSKVVYDESGCSLPENYNGLGYLNLFHMIFNIKLKLLEFRMDNEENKSPADINLFFIEEPEVHTHPQMQYIFIENIKTLLKDECNINNAKLNLQTIITTHSSHIVSKCDFNDIKYFYKNISEDNAINIISKNLIQLEKEYDDNQGHYKFLKQYLTLNRSELFFAEKAIFIEGDTERILLPKMMEMIDNTNSDGSLQLLSQNISIIEVGNYAHIFEKFIDFIGLNSLIITDIDSCKKNDNNKCVKHSVEDSENTSNSSLKLFFGTDKINDFKNFKFKDKVFKKSNNKWECDANGILRIAYQTKHESVDYYPRTFEDAFISLNKDFINDNSEIFVNGLKNVDKLNEIEDYYKLTEQIIDKKPAFAIEILLAIADGNNSFKIPEYIKEGLQWLKNV
jgi:predicted ATP-dependent endonuclease of OLD family